ncbi:PdaC/SigV domain-containing protein [Sphingomonas sp. PAMC 26605]|uniref:PdaC/SigV domain-containing protein n=1 Tax=Sphingomonas sp. PAMC 26605 TaxID=1112214 RepID=UPI00026CB11B|nr:DUF4163 domain-containing protein [Sphingomonas sp. PAMC 26605]
MAAPLNAFTYSVPPQANAYPALRGWFAGERHRLRAAAAAEAAAEKRDAAATHRQYDPYRTSRVWKVVSDLPRFLSLSEERYDYSGGAHGNASYAALVWDKAAKLRRPPIAFFSSPDALKRSVTSAFCQKLNARRDTPGEPEYSPCPDPSKEALILGSTTGRAFDRIGFLLPPYEAGPYAQGSFDITVPVTSAILAAVKPEYRRFFALGPA